MTDMQDLLKEYYAKKPTISALQAGPFFSMVTKDKNWQGKDLHRVPLQYGFAQSISGTASSVFGSPLNAQVDTFDVTRRRIYGETQIDRELLQSSTDSMSLLKAYDAQIKGLEKGIAREWSTHMFLDGTGAIGRVSSGTTTITLTNAGDAINFYVGMKVAFHANLTGTTVDANTATVTAVNVGAGTVIVDDGTSVTSNDYIFRVGNKNKTPHGLAGWVPSTAPTAGDSWFGVDRSVAVELLSGQRLDLSSGGSLEDGLIELASLIGTFSGSPDVAFCSFATWARLAKALQGRGFVNLRDVTVGQVGFKALELAVPGGTVKLMADNSCPSNKVYMLSMDAVKLVSTGDLIQVVDEDSTLVRSTTSDAFNVRVASYGNLIVTAPNACGVLSL